MSRDLRSDYSPKPGGPNNALTYNGPTDPKARDLARLAVHRRANGDEAELRWLIDVLGLYVEAQDVSAGYGRVPCVVDGQLRTKHSRAPKPTSPYRRPRRGMSAE